MAENDNSVSQQRDPYARWEHKKFSMPFKLEVPGRMVAISNTVREDRGLCLITPFTRAVIQHEIHELMLTDEQDARPGAVVNRAAALGFFEVNRSGLLAWGDEVWIGNRLVGEIAGFEMTHFPNHINVVCVTKDKLAGGVDLNLKPDEPLRFKLPEGGGSK